MDAFAALLPAPWRHELGAEQLAHFVTATLADARVFASEEVRRKRVPQITVFAAHCAPRAARAEGLELAVEFLLAFFLLNDDWQATRQLFSETAEDNPSLQFIRAWLARLHASHGARAERFLSGFARYFESLEREKAYEADPGHPTFAEYVDREYGRYQWVATAPYIELWELSQSPMLEVAQRARADALKSLAVESTYLANDIGSLARDRGDKNFVTLLMREERLPNVESALQRTAQLYADKVRALARPQDDAALERYRTLVADITDGNLRATTLLAHAGASGRYAPEVRDCLAALPLCSG